MADYWTTPKTNWITSDGIGYADLNRIEANISANRDANFRKVQGFGYTVDNTVASEDGVVTILPGSCYTSGGVPIKMASNFVKNLTTWAQGNGSGFGGMASAVTVAAHTWYYAFVIMDPTDGSTEIMFDDNVAGTNVSSGTYTEKRFINSFKTGAAGGDSSFDLVEMYSTGDRVVINPNSMYSARFLVYTNTSPNNDDYILQTLDSGGAEGYALPAKAVLADLNLWLTAIMTTGFFSTYTGVFTIPATMGGGGATPNAEMLFLSSTSGVRGDFHLMIDASRQFKLAMYEPSGYTGTVNLAVRGFVDERLN